jgi:hypothetical protein
MVIGTKRHEQAYPVGGRGNIFCIAAAGSGESQRDIRRKCGNESGKSNSD